MIELVSLLLLLLVMAVLYSSVGHGGASGYLVAMAIYGLSPAIMKPVALVMNIAVSSLLIMRFSRAGNLNWRLIMPLIVLSIPFAYLGGGMRITDSWYFLLVGSALVVAAAWMIFKPQDRPPVTEAPPMLPMLLAGSGLGFVSGLTGVGGGIFLSPFLLLMRWADMRTSAGIAAVFIWVNSVAGILGHLTKGNDWAAPVPVALLVSLVIVGRYLGSELNLRCVRGETLRRLLGGVLVIAGVKMFGMAI
jgi:uncharacterized membrane protein YfcA